MSAALLTLKFGTVRVWDIGTPTYDVVFEQQLHDGELGSNKLKLPNSRRCQQRAVPPAPAAPPYVRRIASAPARARNRVLKRRGQRFFQ